MEGYGRLLGLPGSVQTVGDLRPRKSSNLEYQLYWIQMSEMETIHWVDSKVEEYALCREIAIKIGANW